MTTRKRNKNADFLTGEFEARRRDCMTGGLACAVTGEAVGERRGTSTDDCLFRQGVRVPDAN